MDREALRSRLEIPYENLQAINQVLLNPDERVINDLLDMVLRYGTPEEINAQARQAGELSALLERLRRVRPDYLADLEWLDEQRWRNHFISLDEYRHKVLGAAADQSDFQRRSPVNLAISACHFFPWFMQMARQAIQNGDIMPGQFLHVRNMKEQIADGDLLAFAVAMQIIGASAATLLDQRGSDGANLHLGGPDTLLGYYGGVGMPNQYPLLWLDEYLHYYTQYGLRQVLNVNPGTVLLGYLLHRLGLEVEFRISLFLGHDNPYAALWALLTARLLARPDGSTPLVSLTWSGSTASQTIELSASFRQGLGLEQLVQFEQHVTETWKGLVVQPYNRRSDLLALAECVDNLTAMHEGGDPEFEATRERPSNAFDYTRTKSEIISSGDWETLTVSFFDRFEALNRTAWALTERGIPFTAARRLHHR